MLLTRNSFCKGTHFSVILLSLEVGDAFFLSFINSLTALRFRFPLSSGGAPWMACRGPKRKASGVVWLHLTYATGSSKSRESPLSASELCRRPLVSFRLWPIARAPWGKKTWAQRAATCLLTLAGGKSDDFNASTGALHGWRGGFCDVVFHFVLFVNKLTCWLSAFERKVAVVESSNSKSSN